ncbi:MAG TPA: sugar ABC transporter substrate-binding protein [Polyangia bacterium]
MLGTIGLFLRSNDNDYQQRLKEVGLREAKRQGFDIAIESAQNDANRQVDQIRAAIKSASTTKMVAFLVSTVRDDVLPEMVREAAEAGIDWALLNEGKFIDEIRAQYPNRAIFVVSPDQMEIGRIHGRQVRALVGSSGKVLCVTGPVNAVTAMQRLEGLKEVLADDFSIIELNADWTSERARMAVARWAGDLAAGAQMPGMFVAHNDEMALGVRQALRDVALQKDLPLAAAYITGCDGSQTFGQRLVRENRLKATVIMSPASGAAIEWIARVRAKSELPPVRVLQPVTSFPLASSLKR